MKMYKWYLTLSHPHHIHTVLAKRSQSGNLGLLGDQLKYTVRGCGLNECSGADLHIGLLNLTIGNGTSTVTFLMYYLQIPENPRHLPVEY